MSCILPYPHPRTVSVPAGTGRRISGSFTASGVGDAIRRDPPPPFRPAPSSTAQRRRHRQPHPHRRNNRHRSHATHCVLLPGDLDLPTSPDVWVTSPSTSGASPSPWRGFFQIASVLLGWSLPPSRSCASGSVEYRFTFPRRDGTPPRPSVPPAHFRIRPRASVPHVAAAPRTSSSSAPGVFPTPLVRCARNPPDGKSGVSGPRRVGRISMSGATRRRGTRSFRAYRQSRSHRDVVPCARNPPDGKSGVSGPRRVGRISISSRRDLDARRASSLFSSGAVSRARPRPFGYLLGVPIPSGRPLSVAPGTRRMASPASAAPDALGGSNSFPGRGPCATGSQSLCPNPSNIAPPGAAQATAASTTGRVTRTPDSIGTASASSASATPQDFGRHPT